MLPQPDSQLHVGTRAAADELAAQGRRVLLLATSGEPVHDRHGGVTAGGAALPAAPTPAALVVLAERIRADAAESIRFFASQGVALKVISGDNPRTVGAVAAQVGIPGVASAADAVDATGLPSDPDRLGEALEAHSAFGRVTPQQKRAMVAALQHRGHVVAMTGVGLAAWPVAASYGGTARPDCRRILVVGTSCQETSKAGRQRCQEVSP